MRRRRTTGRKAGKKTVLTGAVKRRKLHFSDGGHNDQNSADLNTADMRFNPIEIRGEALSATILRERR